MAALILYAAVGTTSAAAASCLWWAGIWWRRGNPLLGWLDGFKAGLWLTFAVVYGLAAAGALNVADIAEPVLRPALILLAMTHVIQRILRYIRDWQFIQAEEDVVRLVREAKDSDG